MKSYHVATEKNIAWVKLWIKKATFIRSSVISHGIAIHMSLKMSITITYTEISYKGLAIIFS